MLCLGFLAAGVSAHSWARCTNYHAEITGGDYNEDECSGWIRTFDFNGLAFGTDRGFNYQVGVGAGGSICAQQPFQGSSDDAYGLQDDKAASYKVGETIRVVWPAKNHANYECSNNIPDTSMKLFMNPTVNPTGDLPNNAGTMEGNGYELVKDWQEDCTGGTDGCGFQNCPKFCDNTDKATCFGDFVVPDVGTSGYYTFVWYWIFNPGSPYISCYEAYIDADTVVADTEETEFTESAGDGVTGTRAGYLTQAPYCISGDDYDASLVQGFAQTQFSGVATVDLDDIEVVSVSEESGSFNFTVQISHDDGGSEITAIAWAGTTEDESPFCERFQIQFAGSSCVNCFDTITYAQYEGGSSAPVIGLAPAFALVAVLVAFLN